jgi:FkbM family methyltransferase
MMTFLKSFLRKARHRLRSWLGRDVFIQGDVRVPVEHHGSAEGGWAISQDSLGPKSVVYSVGIGEDASFDLSLIRKYGCSVHAFDPTPKALEWAARNCQDERFQLLPVALAKYDGSLRLFLPRNPQYVSASLEKTTLTSEQYFDAPCHRLATLMKRLGHDHLDVLKMDIEGAEYEVIDECVASGVLQNVSQLLIEFHHWIPQFGVQRTQKALMQLRSCGFQVAWVSQWGYEVLCVRQAAARN